MSALGRVLIVANTAYMIRQFNMENIKLLQGMGYQVEVACNFLQGNPISKELIEEFLDFLGNMGVVCHQVSFIKSPHRIIKNISAYKLLIRLMKERNYNYIHCQTPMGGAISRLAANKMKIPAIYMVHGFHFHKNAGLFSWLLYYPVEKWLSSFTDALVVINQEDYLIAKKKMKPKCLYYVPGVGIDVKAFSAHQEEIQLSRCDIGIPEDKTFVLSVGELNKNKNHETVIRAIAELPDVHYVIAGTGCLKDYLWKVAKELDITDRVHLLGFRKDVQVIYSLADIYCHPSFREGLSVAVMEAMAAGLPVVCSDIRGNEDLIDNGEGGILIKKPSVHAYVESLESLIQDRPIRIKMGNHNIRRIERYDIRNVNQIMKEIYLGIQSDA